jgi:hypothetical protein
MTAYSIIEFDEELKRGFNQYVKSKLFKSVKICSIEDIIGQLEIWFKKTNYESLKFQISEETISGEEDKFYSVC